MEQKKLKQREALLVEAFADMAFQQELEVTQLALARTLREFVAYLRATLRPEQKVYENLESRIKGADSFREKLYRKDYIKNWPVSRDMAENQRTICQKLPDLLGFRINCFFWQEEAIIYEMLRAYHKEGKLSGGDGSRIELDFSENTKQKNGHDIYKVSGTYYVADRSYNFEVQIKSIMHNIWGEVEHKTIYKNRNYDPDIDSKVAITGEVFNILQASDKQLVSLFKKRNDEKELTYALFFEQTKEKIQKRSGTDILGRHYKAFFTLFADSRTEQEIKRRVAKTLQGQNYQPAKVELERDSTEIAELRNRITEEFLEYNLKCLYYICALVYGLNRYGAFLDFLADRLLVEYVPVAEESDLYEDFDDEGEEDQMSADVLDGILTMLENTIGGRKKHD